MVSGMDLGSCFTRMVDLMRGTGRKGKLMALENFFINLEIWLTKENGRKENLMEKVKS